MSKNNYLDKKFWKDVKEIHKNSSKYIADDSYLYTVRTKALRELAEKEAEEKYKNLTKQELVKRVAKLEIALKMEKQWNKKMGAELSAFNEKLKNEHIKRQQDGRARTINKTIKFAQHTKKQELARDIIKKMKSKSKTIKTSDSKEFYKLMTAACSRANLGAPSLSTLANYFKKYTGLKSTK